MRVTGSAKQFSDLDLAIVGNEAVPIETLNEIKFDFSNSDLPIMIDIIDWHAIPQSFRDKIQSQCVTLIQAT